MTVKIIAKGFEGKREIETIEKGLLFVGGNQQRLHTLAKRDEVIYVYSMDGEMLYPLAKY